MGFLSREIVRRVGPFVAVGAAGAAGAVLAQRRFAERRKLSLTPGPPRHAPVTATGPVPPAPQPAPPTPTPDPIPAPVPTPHPEPPTPVSSPRERILEETVRSALVAAAPDGSGAVDVEVAGSMVVLRGRVDTREAIRELERAAAGVPGVDGVRVLLHLPGRAARRSA